MVDGELVAAINIHVGLKVDGELVNAINVHLGFLCIWVFFLLAESCSKWL